MTEEGWKYYMAVTARIFDDCERELAEIDRQFVAMTDDSGDCQPLTSPLGAGWNFNPSTGLWSHIEQAEYIWTPPVEQIFPRPKLNEEEERDRLWKLVQEASNN